MSNNSFNDNGNGDGNCDDDMDYCDKHIIKLRGLPWNVCLKDILEWLEGVDVVDGENGIHLITSARDGRPNGECFIECATEDDVSRAFELNKKNMGHRYIEVFKAKMDEYVYSIRKRNFVRADTYVKLRGLPYSCTPLDIAKFFSDLELKRGLDSIHVLVDYRNRATGEAFVQFDTEADTEKALKKSREMIGHRYIEIFRSTVAEARRAKHMQRRPTPYDRNDDGPGRLPVGCGYGRDNDNTAPPNFNNRGGGNNFDDDFGGNNFNNRGGGGGGGGGFGGNSGNNNANIDLLRLLSEQLNRGNDNNYGGNRSNYSGDNGPSKDLQSILDLDRNFRNGGFGGGNSNKFGNFGGNGNGNNFGGRNSFGGGGNDRKEFCVRLRGMPYDCDEQDIYDFFAPLIPKDCVLEFDTRGRPRGEGLAYFESYDDAMKAMKKHKESMGTRYIELYLQDDDKFQDKPRDFLGKKFNRLI